MRNNQNEHTGKVCPGFNANNLIRRIDTIYTPVISAFIPTFPAGVIISTALFLSAPSVNIIRYSSSAYNGLVARYEIFSGSTTSKFSGSPPPRRSLHRSNIEIRFKGP